MVGAKEAIEKLFGDHPGLKYKIGQGKLESFIYVHGTEKVEHVINELEAADITPNEMSIESGINAVNNHGRAALSDVLRALKNHGTEEHRQFVHDRPWALAVGAEASKTLEGKKLLDHMVKKTGPVGRSYRP